MGEMIQANELRIDNLLNFDRFGEIRIFKIDPDHIRMCFDFNDEFNLYYKPILITKEWLLKFGFKQDVLAERILFKSKPDRYKFCQIVDHYENGWLLSFDWWNQTGKMIKYIHQLQNIYYFIDETELILNE